MTTPQRLLPLVALLLGLTQMRAYDLSGLPDYKVEHKVTEFEPIRLYGSGLNGLADALCEGFRK